MAAYDEILFAVIDLAQSTSPFAEITIGALPPDNGISMAISTGSTESTFFNKDTISQIGIVLNAKSRDGSAQMLLDDLWKIHRELAKMTNYPSGETWQIFNIQTNAGPHYIGREQNNQLLYGSSIQVNFYER